MVENNFFQGNIGLKKHNGGAGVIRCKHIDETFTSEYTYLANNMRNPIRNSLGEIELADPSTHQTQIIDYFDLELRELQHSVLTFGTLIANNTFSSNYSGKRGSALLIELVNEL